MDICLQNITLEMDVMHFKILVSALLRDTPLSSSILVGKLLNFIC